LFFRLRAIAHSNGKYKLLECGICFLYQKKVLGFEDVVKILFIWSESVLRGCYVNPVIPVSGSVKPN
jgi:hypothetical protein